MDDRIRLEKDSTSVEPDARRFSAAIPSPLRTSRALTRSRHHKQPTTAMRLRKIKMPRAIAALTPGDRLCAAVGEVLSTEADEDPRSCDILLAMRGTCGR